MLQIRKPPNLKIKVVAMAMAMLSDGSIIKEAPPDVAVAMRFFLPLGEEEMKCAATVMVG